MNNDEMLDGYLDGFGDDRTEMPASLDNRSHSYRHGWMNGRDDRLNRPRDSAESLRRQAELAESKDKEKGAQPLGLSSLSGWMPRAG